MVSTLGRGLGSLLGSEAVLELEKVKVREVPLDHIVPNVNQPRKNIAEDALQELANSILAQGVLQPILVRLSKESQPSKPRYELVAGERRWRASKLAGLDKIPVLVRDWSDDQSLEVAILENVQREELNPIETARGYENLVQLFGYSHKKVGKRVGKSRVAVSNMLRLLELPEPVLDLVSENKISMGHARALLGANGGFSEMIRLANLVIGEDLSVRATEALIRRQGEEGSVVEPKVSKPGRGLGGRRREPSIVELEQKLRSVLSTAVTVTCVKGRGKIILEFNDTDKLEALSEILLK
ncbi:MAG: ParB/RepB/Spo0J family partition protein [Magnetococcales bacterium]|nr:ParB/RepB/Spo0J family partition protein [Magnetococcales bacterium]